jgi:hypothetical protein
MRILLDECAPRGLRRALPGHNVLTLPELGWSGKKNGELMRLIAAHGFEAFLTVDQNVSFHQNLASANFAVIVLAMTSNRLADLLPLVPKILAALPTIQPGDLIEIRP